jgi:hypothetical protein
VLPAQTTYLVTGNGNQLFGSYIRTHERIDYTSSLVTQQLYQQNLYQASNATRDDRSRRHRYRGCALTTGALFQRTETFTGTNIVAAVPAAVPASRTSAGTETHCSGFRCTAP